MYLFRLIHKNSGVSHGMFCSVKENLHFFMFTMCCHFLKHFISVPEKVFSINPGSQVLTAHRPRHLLETISCLLHPNRRVTGWGRCVAVLLKTGHLGDGIWMLTSTLTAACSQTCHSNVWTREGRVALSPNDTARLQCVVRWKKAVALQSYYSACKI